jgi:hypothetical protein
MDIVKIHSTKYQKWFVEKCPDFYFLHSLMYTLSKCLILILFTNDIFNP